MSNVEARVSLNIDVPPSATRFDHNARCYLESRKVNWLTEREIPRNVYVKIFWQFWKRTRYRVTILRYSIHADIPYRNRVQPIKNITSILSYYSDSPFFFFFISLILHARSLLLSQHGLSLGNIIIYNYDSVLLLTLHDSLASYVMMIPVLNNTVFEPIIFFWQLKVKSDLLIRSLYDIFQFFDHSQSLFNNIYKKKKKRLYAKLVISS